MANDETPKIEPTLVLRDAPSIAADEPRPEPKIEPGEVATVEASKTESKAPDTPQARVDARSGCDLPLPVLHDERDAYRRRAARDTART